jgi:plasmid stability protein
MVLVAVFENRRGPDELAAKLGRVLDLSGRKSGLESLLVNIQAEAIQAAQNGK